MLVAVRTAPHHSYRNPVERIMSLLNIGLQSVGVMRQKMSNEMEQAIHGAKSMTDVRNVAEKKPNLKESFLASVKPAILLLSETLSRLELKGRQFKITGSLSEVDIGSLFSHIHSVDPEVARSHTEKRHLSSLPSLKSFLGHCCQTRQYFFSIRKCGRTDCNMCKPPRLPPDVFCQLHSFPHPIPEPGSNSYKDFHSAYGTATTEKYRPSLVQKKQDAPFRLAGETVRSIVICGECLKPRCLYASKALSSELMTLLESCKEDNIFVCGSSFLPPESELSQLCWVERSNCDAEVNGHYYSSRLKLQRCCYVCGALAELVEIPPEKARAFQSIHPVCTLCKDAGKFERTRGKRTAGQKRPAPVI